MTYRYLHPVHQEARLLDGDKAMVREVQSGTVVREFERDLRTFSEEQRHRILVKAVSPNGWVRLA